MINLLFAQLKRFGKRQCWLDEIVTEGTADSPESVSVLEKIVDEERGTDCRVCF